MELFNAEHTPADIVKEFPHASDLFKEHMVDFCCGGDKPLKETFQEEKNLDGNSILARLNTGYKQWKKSDHDHIDWDQVPINELVNHIMHHHHAFLKKELPALGEYVLKVDQAHGANQPHLKELCYVYNEFKMEMAEHTIKEENDVFPLIKTYVSHPGDELLQKIH